MRQTHDYVVDRAGVFDKAIEMIREGKRLGYYVCTNTTVYRETEVDEIEAMCHRVGIAIDVGDDKRVYCPNVKLVATEPARVH